MTKVIKGSFELMKQLNIAAVLEVLRIRGRMSRAEIAEITGLTPASVTNITKILIDGNYLKETGIGESSGGRPPVIIELNPEARYIVGVNLGIGSIEVALTNLEAKIVIKKSIEIKDEDNEKEQGLVLNKLINLIEEVTRESGKSRENILGIGIAMHGVVNVSTGISKFAPYYNWRDVEIRRMISEYFGYPVFIDNDVRAMALGESWFGVAKGTPNFITINISNGIGAGIIIDNKPYYGVDYSAGEIGHIVVDTDGPRCYCGNYGCLESIASNKSIVKKAIKLIKQGAATQIGNGIDKVEDITVKDISDAANAGDELAVTLLKEAGRYVGIIISNLVNILNPIEVVMVGEIFSLNEYAIESIKATIKNIGFQLPLQKLSIIKSGLGSDAALIGAVTLVLKELFKGEKFKFY